MKKKIIFIITSLLLSVFLCGCECKHEKWNDATCTTPKTCVDCGKTKGEALGHEWTKADCENPSICKVCGEIEGNALGHDWIEADCEHPRTCSVCKKTEGEALDHDWEEATCKSPRKCKRCSETLGKALDHKIETWTITEESSCDKQGKESGECTLCHSVIDREIGKIDHTPGEWEITKEATAYSDGVKEKKCTVCGQTVDTEYFSKSADEIKSEYKAKCVNYTYDEIARNPDDYNGKYAKFTGEVVQVMEDDDFLAIRMNITLTGNYYTYYKDTIYVCYFRKSGESRILEDDIITVYGELMGLTSYESVGAGTITLPLMYAEYID